MMYGFGTGGWWMVLMPLLWLALLAPVAWAVVRAGRPDVRESALEILDRRYARGEIDDTTYTTARARLSGRGPGAG
jgi:putative membrane protein